MSQQVTEAFVQEFASNFRHVAQQQVSRFEGAVMVDSGIVGTSKSVNRLGQRQAQRRINRHSDTPLNDQPHSTRFVDLFDWEDGDMIDLDISARSLHLDVSDAELALRREQWTAPVPAMRGGYQQMYMDHVLQADQGVDLDFLVGCRGAAVPRESH